VPDYLPLPDGDAWDQPEDWCPACESYHPADVPCTNESDPDPEPWGLDDVVTLGPEPAGDGWYLDLVARAEHPGIDPHDEWRD
jgi:hypothetical protein